MKCGFGDIAVIYLRVSTTDQHTSNQEHELRQAAERAGWGVVKVYKDHGISGAKGRDKRPAFDALHRDAAKRQFDVVMAWNVDRLGRSLQNLLAVLSELHAPGSICSSISRGSTRPPGQQGHVPDAWRLCRVRALDHPRTSPRRASASP
jgi:DNA invertase Pin-like site-specific DNA recombinase